MSDIVADYTRLTPFYPGQWGVIGSYVPSSLIPLLPAGAGNIFFVDGGSTGPTVDTGDGLTPVSPKRLLQSAINMCASGHNDVVIVLNYGGNARAVETFPILLNKDQTHIVGVQSPSNKWPVVSVLTPAGADTADPAILVTGQRCSIRGLELGGGNTAGCLHVGSVGGVWGCYVYDCFFGWTSDSVGQDGIRVVAGSDAPFLTVTGCRFGSSLTRDGVRIDGNATRGSIGLPGFPKNIFKRIPGIGVNLVGNTVGIGVFDNIMALPSNTAGKGVTISAGSTLAMVDGNRCNFGDSAMANNPYADGAAGGANDWLANYQALTLVMPT